MTDLNKVNFMSKARFDNLSVTNDDELYLVETNIAVDEEVVHKSGDETIAGNKTFSNNVVVTGTTTLNNALTVNNNVTVTGTTTFGSNAKISGVLLIPNNVNSNASYSNGYIELMPSTTSSFGGYVDFHYSGSSDDYTARLIEDAQGQISYYGANSLSVSNSTTTHTIAVKGWVNDPALSTNVVHRTGNETIGGNKFFNGGVTRQTGDDIGYLVKLLNADNTSETQSTQTFGYYRTVDNNNKIIGDFRVVRTTVGTVTSSMIARNYASSESGVNAVISCSIDNEGNIYTSAPTPASPTDNSTQIATTAWVNNKIQFVNALPASPVSGVLYLIPET